MVDMGKVSSNDRFIRMTLISRLIRQMYSPETGGRSFEENQAFFGDAKKWNSWSVHKVNKGEFRGMPNGEKHEDGESQPLLGNGS